MWSYCVLLVTLWKRDKMCPSDNPTMEKRMHRSHRNNIELNECFSNTKKDSQKNKSVHRTRKKLFTQSGLHPQFCNTDRLPLYCNIVVFITCKLIIWSTPIHQRMAEVERIESPTLIFGDLWKQKHVATFVLRVNMTKGLPHWDQTWFSCPLVVGLCEWNKDIRGHSSVEVHVFGSN